MDAANPEVANNDQPALWRRVLGWVAFTISMLFTCFWASWGIIENFHEGWYHPSLATRIAMMFGQYLSVMFAFQIAVLITIKWPRIGSLIHLSAGLFSLWFFSGGAAYRLIVPPLLGLCFCYWFGVIRPKIKAILIAVFLPLIVVVSVGYEPALKVANRIDDGLRGSRHLTANDVDLVWAPMGPGWPTHGVDWFEALRRCEFLSADGKTLAKTPQNIWRLPTVEEAVRSQCLHGKNAGGQWDPKAEKARYLKSPDKETPLWHPHSKVIYWWTATEKSQEMAFMITYQGKVYPRSKAASYGYHAFRAVKNP